MSSVHARNHTTDFDLNSFLYKFGYLQHARANAASGSSEEEIVEFAIRTYQRNFGIGVTGKLDDETKSRMKGAVAAMAISSMALRRLISIPSPFFKSTSTALGPTPMTVLPQSKF